MRVLEANDQDFAYRQIGIIDREGRAVAHTGVHCGTWAGHQVGECYAAFGNGLAGAHVLAGIVSGFVEAEAETLEYRLLRAIEGGRDAGGQAANGIRRPERSAWIRVVGPRDVPEVDVRVDLHTHAVDALRGVLEEVGRRESCCRARARSPAEAPDEESHAS
jgi:uncharacterized Ntn-hydrolase superfamily protein